jgi:hypothetical protein
MVLNAAYGRPPRKYSISFAFFEHAHSLLRLLFGHYKHSEAFAFGARTAKPGPHFFLLKAYEKEQALHTNPVLSCSIPHPGVLCIILSRHIFMHPGRTSSQVIFHAHSYQFFCFTDISTLHVATEHMPTCNVFTISEQHPKAMANVPHPLRRIHDSAI